MGAMRRRARRSDMSTLRLVGLGWLAWALAPGLGQATTLDVCARACTYSGIQTAVDAAAPGDVIDIRAGTYAGDVDVSVSNLTITGAGSGVTIVEGLGFAAFVFRDTATPVTLSGVTLRSPVAVSCLYNYGAA
jgi:pectin methylesterase-like acyl-CoA thioesterase